MFALMQNMLNELNLCVSICIHNVMGSLYSYVDVT